jgi:hypothetical protein
MEWWCNIMATADVTYPEVRLHLPCELLSARRGRRFVSQAVANWDTGMDGAQRNLLQLLTTELITNCIVHACSAYHELTVVQEIEGVRVSVTDGEVDRLVLVRGEHLRVLAGRGLNLITTYADDCGVDEVPTGHVIWFRLLNSYLGPPQPMPMPKQRRRLEGHFAQ